MKRESIAPRPDWVERLVEIDFHAYRHQDGAPYWREDQCYVLKEAEVERLHEAALAVQQMVDAALARVFAEKRLARLGLPTTLHRLAEASWQAGEPSLYGRMDFAFDGDNPPILLEYNADTPTALYEAAVVQWRWLTDRDPSADQYNSIQEQLISRWRRVAGGAARVHVASLHEAPEDLLTAEYLRECANAAGVATRALDMGDIGWDGARFVDLADEPIETMFKLYPWEWMMEEAFAEKLQPGAPRMIEPPWRLAASSKALLADLWEMFPKAENLVPAFREPGKLAEEFVVKPIFGREGSGVRFGRRAPLHGAAGEDESCVYQRRVRIRRFGGMTPVFGVWVIGGTPCGLGVREDEAEITGPKACFAPHRID